MRRVFDICHGCRRCFNLCDSFPRLFDLIDSSPNEELSRREVGRFRAGRGSLHAVRHVLHDQVPLCAAARLRSGFSPSDAARTAPCEAKTGQEGFHAEPARRDGPQRHGWRASLRAADQLGVGQEQRADAPADGEASPASTATRDLPKFHASTFVAADRGDPSRPTARRPPSASARPRSMPPASSTTTSRPPAWRRARCSIISASRPRSPIPAAAACRSWNRPIWRASPRTRRKCPRNWCKLIDEGYDIVALTASCGLMLKFEWPLIVPGQSKTCKRWRKATFDIDEYVVDIAKKEGLPAGLKPLPEGVTVHLPAMPAPRTWARRRRRC